MTKSSKYSPMKEDKDREIAPPFKGDVLAKGIVTGVAVSTINHAGRSIVGTVARHPLIMFGMGVIVGYFTHKYRKEIVQFAEQTTEQGKKFVLRQKENLLDLVAENQENVEDQRASK